MAESRYKVKITIERRFHHARKFGGEMLTIVVA